MPDIQAINAAVSSIKIAIEIVDFLNKTNTSIKTALLSSKIAELTYALSEAHIQMAETKQLIIEKNATISKLEQQLDLKQNTIKHLEAFYIKDNNGKPFGEPYCPRCFETDIILIHLVSDIDNRSQVRCPECKNVYRASRCPIVR